ncbi:MAG: hypothetical protein M0D53_05170 [Flavobacterium sp. JAD_PAG50586_2]|nr:MAG: hypothetical protein M0D53_05170 [Flavobacterium sp. JAD_PAG50586_2]
MKTLLLYFLSLSCLAGFSQTSKIIHGKVSYQNSYQGNVDVINFNTKEVTQTNTLGEFNIEAKKGDVLIFMSENFADQKLKLTAGDLERTTFIIKLEEKPVPLEEVEIQQVKAIKVEGGAYNAMKIAKIERDVAHPRNKDVYTGEIENGVDFVQIGKWVGKLFKSKNPKNKKAEETLPFKEYATTNFNPAFFSKTLKLKPEETSRFLEYCEADPASKTVVEKNDELAVLEFLMTKKTEFDKLK